MIHKFELNLHVVVEKNLKCNRKVQCLGQMTSSYFPAPNTNPSFGVKLALQLTVALKCYSISLSHCFHIHKLR